MNKLSIQATFKCGIIYRNGPRKFVFDCAFCDQVLIHMNFVFDHIEAHFSSTNNAQSVTPLPTEEIFLKEQVQIKEETDNGVIKLEPDELEELDLIRKPTTLVHPEPVPESVEEVVNNSVEDINMKKIASAEKKRLRDKLYKRQKVQCDICGITSSRNNIKNHMDIHINIDKYKCSFCDKMFPTQLRLRNHKDNHQIIPCQFCGKMFTKSILKFHIPTHTGDRLYKCSICEKSFIQRTALKGHMLVHTNERKHKCNQCDDAFKRKVELQKHMWRCHNEERPQSQKHKCEICGNVYTVLASLRDHQRVHTGERPFSCKDCGLTFTKSSSLRSHLLIHIGERNYKCRYCEQSFVQAASRYCHERRMHNIQWNQRDQRSS